MEEHVDYHISHDVRDYARKSGVLLVSTLYNTESEIRNMWNIKFQISSEIIDNEGTLEEKILERSKTQEKNMIRVYNFYKDMMEGNV